MRIKKFIVALMAITLIATGIIGNGNHVKAFGNLYGIVFAEEDYNLTVKPGETTHLKLPIKATGMYIALPKIEISADNSAPFTFTTPKITVLDNVVSGISTYNTTYLEFDVKVKETASIGNYPVNIKFSYSNEIIGDESTTLSTYLQIVEEKEPAQLIIKDVTCKNPFLGAKTDLSFVVKNEGEITARNIYFNIDYTDSGMAKNYTTKDVKIGELGPNKEYTVTLPVSILPTTNVGVKNLKVNFTYKNIDGDPLKSEEILSFEVKRNQEAPDLYIENVTYEGDLTPGGEFVIVATLCNFGGSEAKNISVAVDGTNLGVSGFIKKYYTDIPVKDMTQDGKREVKIPLMVSKGAEGGIKDLKINIYYKDDTGLSYTKVESVYPEVIGKETAAGHNIIISSVGQNPSSPVAGEKLEVSFDFENKGTSDITELKISLDNLNGDTFIPIEAEPYQYIEKVAAGTKLRITFPLIVSDSIPEGLNNLGIKYTYTGGEGNVTLPIRNVQNDLGSNSKPKLIVSKYTTDVEKLKAGGTFNFTFDLYNTHSSISAKNITVTVTQAENVFTPTQGSNSFFISKIDAGESVSNTLELKIKSDASTKAYPIVIKIDYEYDGAEPNPTTGEIGETKEEVLNLQAAENSRPVVDYVNVYSWEGNVIVGNPATLAFEFYNMGKSPLNNVVATVEGDLMKSDGSMYFIGNVPEGGSAYAEFEVIPNIEGTAKGVVKITFEDSNGDLQEYVKEFEAMVMGAQPWEPMPGEGMPGEVFNPGPIAKKPILPTWLFIIIEIIIFVIFIPITRKVIISVYKSKLRKKELE